MELASPITVYWDLPGGEPGYDFIEKVCGDIMACRPLMLQVGLVECHGADVARQVLDCFDGTTIAVSLTVPFELLDLPAMAVIGEQPMKELLFRIDSLHSLVGLGDDLGKLVERARSGMVVGIAFEVNDRNWRELPEIARHCRDAGINRLVLPMQRLCSGEAPFYITAAEQETLAVEMAAAGGLAGLNVTIHDPFLWRAFHPETPFPQAGCQAANTMIYVASDGSVYPCPTLPLLLGNVREMSLKEIVASPEKKSLRRQLLKAPADCSQCGEVAVCRGGCRGRGLVLLGSLDGIDSACR